MEFQTRMCQGLAYFKCIGSCDLWIQGKKCYLSCAQEAALEAEGHPNLSTIWLADKTALTDTDLDCSKSFLW